MATLYLVATPIGNLEDMSQRAVRILGEVNLIAAEDTRRTRRLLSAFGIRTPLTSYYEHSGKSKTDYLLGLLASEDIALVSDAGMPGMSDPGYELVRGAVERGAQVTAIPGPSVVPAALAVSGLPSSQFVFLGFLPRKKGERLRLLESVAKEERTLVAFEAPHRVLSALAAIEEALGDRAIAVCRELTKIHEEVFRGTVGQALAHFSQPRGEFTLVIAGCGKEPLSDRIAESVIEELVRLRTRGFSARDAVAEISASTGLPKKALYRAWLELP
jgi:16S rRNA (cytidine1402-2'-O)-methyltransferase